VSKTIFLKLKVVMVKVFNWLTAAKVFMQTTLYNVKPHSQHVRIST